MIKHSRFPNLDVPLNFFFMISLLSAYTGAKKSEALPWLVSGISFGLALWTKGIAAVFIPWLIFLYLLFDRKIRALLSPWPWFGMILGLGVFALWPFLLAQGGQLYVFEEWFKHQFWSTVVDGRGRVENNYFFYLLHLVMNTMPLLILGGIWQWKNRAQKKSSLDILMLTWFLGILVPMSFMKFKYSHYIFPLYLPLGYLAAKAILNFPDRYLQYIKKFVPVFIFVWTSLILVTFQGKKIRRDPALLKGLELVKHLPERPKKWFLLEDTLPFWSASPLIYLLEKTPIYRPGRLGQLEEALRLETKAVSVGTIMSRESYQILLRDFPQYREQSRILADLKNEEVSIILFFESEHTPIF